MESCDPVLIEKFRIFETLQKVLNTDAEITLRNAKQDIAAGVRIMAQNAAMNQRVMGISKVSVYLRGMQ